MKIGNLTGPTEGNLTTGILFFWKKKYKQKYLANAIGAWMNFQVSIYNLKCHMHADNKPAV